jgi:pantoate--beta-alanine ligase
MMTVSSIAELRAARAGARGPVGFVPTMGALHAGHESLFRAARARCGTVVASIFVNPRQFTDPADFARYPRALDADAARAAALGVDLLFAPDAVDIYPPDHATTIDMRGPALGFESDFRPGHFQGVAIVCLSLFNLVGPDEVFLGQKDAQQVAVLSQFVRDVHLPIAIHVVPTVRDADGVALSSRNARLSASERASAAAIPRALRAGLAAHRDGRDPVAAARAELVGLTSEYVDVARWGGEPTLVVAVRAGATRLIDNVPLDHPERAGLGRV